MPLTVKLFSTTKRLISTFQQGLLTALVTVLAYSPVYANQAADKLQPAIASHKVTIHMAGDSTMAIKDPKDYPETGWGVPFATFFNDSTTVINYAKNGRSTRTFIEEGLWAKLMSTLQPGDFVIIQFGHNDESNNKPDRYTTPGQYQDNLRRFINDVRNKGAEPLLMTPVTRRYFDKNGNIKETHKYSPLARKIAATDDSLIFIDMDAITREYFQALGDAGSALRFMHIRPAVHPNYPNGVRDNTHFNQLGAREVAQLVLAELKRINHPIAKQLREPDPKHLRLSYD